MIVDDDEINTKAVKSMLNDQWSVITANSGESALELLKKQIPDLILLDVMLPDGTGYDFCKEVREKGIMIPIIFLSAVAEEVNIVQGLGLGADDPASGDRQCQRRTAGTAWSVCRSAGRTPHTGPGGGNCLCLSSRNDPHGRQPYPAIDLHFLQGTLYRPLDSIL